MPPRSVVYGDSNHVRLTQICKCAETYRCPLETARADVFNIAAHMNKKIVCRTKH